MMARVLESLLGLAATAREPTACTTGLGLRSVAARGQAREGAGNAALRLTLAPAELAVALAGPERLGGGGLLRGGDLTCHQLREDRGDDPGVRVA